MIPESFNYHLPQNLEEAGRLLAEFGEEGKILAGGHSLLPMMKLRLAAPRHLIDLSRLGELRYIRETGDAIEIGALATHYQIESSDLLKSRCPLLPEVAREIGDPQVRNRGTLGGSLAHADPAADWPAAMLALEAEILLWRAGSSRSVAAREFFVGLFTTARDEDEILAGVRIPMLPARTGAAYAKLHHPASGYAAVGAAAVITLNEAKRVESARVGVTGAAATAYRATKTEEALRGKSAAPRVLEEAAALTGEGIEFNSDLYASAEFRAHLTRAYARRALEKAAARAAATAES